MASSARQTVEVTPHAKAGVDSIIAWSGLSQKLIVERTMTWIASQDRNVQGAILMATPDSMQPDFARLVLEKMAEGAEQGDDGAMKLHRADPPPSKAKRVAKKLPRRRT